MSIQKIIDDLIAREGGYVDNPADRGGATNYGITEATARRNGYAGLMRDLKRDQAVSIYVREYVTAPGFGKVAVTSMNIAEELIDSGVNCGPGVPAKWLQRILNLLNRQAKLFPDLVVDGALGTATMTALAYVLDHRGIDGEKIILRALNCLQGAYYIDITEKRPANEEFIAGWFLNRVA